MNRVILYASVGTIAFIVGVAVNWSINSLGGFAVDKLYIDASIPGFTRQAVDDETWNRKDLGCTYRKREVVNGDVNRSR